MSEPGTQLLAVSPDDIAALPASHHGEIVTQALIESKNWLAVAQQATDPTPIAQFKAWAATVAEMTKQKGLAAEIQADATEMVRRAERGIGVAIRNGQEAGQIRKASETVSNLVQNVGVVSDNSGIASPADFASKNELTNTHGGIYDLTDGVSDAQFEDAIEIAREEGNISRANVVRKIQGIKSDKLTPAQRLQKIREMAEQGNRSAQIAAEVGVSEEYVRLIARDNDIDIPADRLTRGTRRAVDHNRIVNETVNSLEGLVVGLQLLNINELDATQADHWATSLTASLKELSRLNKQIKEMPQ